MTDTFSRGALDMTFRLLKPGHPQLALLVRNLLNNSRDNSEMFAIDISEEQVSAIIAGLEEAEINIQDPGMQIVAQALLRDWQLFKSG